MKHLSLIHAPNGNWTQSHPDAIINYIAWDGTKWTAKFEGDHFIHAPNGNWTQSHPDAIINYITWDGTKWTAKFEGDHFIHAPNGNWTQSHPDAIINYITWDGTKWTAKITSIAEMAEEILNAHNQYRAQVGVPPLTWSDSLAKEAQEWANYLTSNLLFQHSQGKGEGENIWMGTSRAYSFTQMIQRFGDEKQFYNHDIITESNFQTFGHYTQMVWRNTTQVGCAGFEGRDGNYRLVCRYSPPGNVPGQRAY